MTYGSQFDFREGSQKVYEGSWREGRQKKYIWVWDMCRRGEGENNLPAARDSKLAVREKGDVDDSSWQGNVNGKKATPYEQLHGVRGREGDERENVRKIKRRRGKGITRLLGGYHRTKGC